MKMNVSFRLDWDKYQKFKQICGGRPSELIQQIIDIVVETPLDESDRLRMLKLQLASYRIARKLLLQRLKIIEQTIADLEMHIQHQEQIVKAERRDEEVRKLILQLNQLIRELDYDITKIWRHAQFKLLKDKLEHFGFRIDRNWLAAQIERLLVWG